MVQNENERYFLLLHHGFVSEKMFEWICQNVSIWNHSCFNVEFKLFQPFKQYENDKPKMCFEKPHNTKDLAAKWVQSWGHAKQCTDFHSHEELKQLVPKKMIKEELYLSYNFICP